MVEFVIAGTQANGVDLFNPLLNPVVVATTINFGTSTRTAALQGETSAAWSIVNQGSILGGTALGINLFAGGTVTNEATALIAGVLGVEIQGLAGTVTNAGTIDSTAGGVGVFLAAGGAATNEAGGRILAGGDGVTINGGAGTIVNAGTIAAGAGGAGNNLLAGGAVTNAAGGFVTGKWGISFGGAGSVLNAGIITGGSQSGVFLVGGTVINEAGGTIAGNWGVADVGAAGTVISAGTIIGANGTAVTLPAGFANLMAVRPGAVFSGVADGGNAIGGGVVSTLELAAASLQGTLTGLGKDFIDFGQVVIDPGASWRLTGTNNTLAAGATLAEQGLLTISAATLMADGTGIVSGVAGTAASTAITKGGSWSGASTLVIGDAGAGEFFVDDLATVAAATISLGLNAGGSGRLSATGTGSGISTTSSLTVGRAGSGHLTVEGHATVNVGGGLEIAAIGGGAGDVTVTGLGSALADAAKTTVGEAGAAGLTILSGGTVSAATGATIANTGSASGSSVNVIGAGSTWQVGGTLTVGNAGFGSMAISQGGAVTAGGLDLAASAGGNGVVSVVGKGSTLTVTKDIAVGDRSTGEMSILGGAFVTAANVYVGGNTAGGGSGNLDIQGAGSHLKVTGTVFVGANGPGVFTFGNGTTLTGTEKTLVNGIANLGGINDPPYIPNDGINNLLDGYVGDADIAVQNSGLFDVKPGTATVNSPLITFDPDPLAPGQTGQWKIENGGTLVLNTTSVDASQVFTFNGTAGVLVLGQVPYADPALLDSEGAATVTGEIKAGSPNVLAGFQAPIQNYKAGDQILFNGLTFGSETHVNNTVTLWSGVGGTGNALGSLTFVTSVFGADKAGATAAAAQMATLACFAAGTLIRTPSGPRPVEDLAVGDEVTLADGGSAPAVWVGARSVDCARHPRPETVWPMRVRAGAFGVGASGVGVPARDLFLSPDHAVFVEGVLVPVKLLANGTSIVQEARARVTYHHVELAEHAVILAEGLAVESYLDTGDRADFGGADTVRLFPDFGARLAPAAAHVWETKGAAPLVMAGAALERARRGAGSRAWPHHVLALTGGKRRSLPVGEE